jgi:hypothetical protein
MVVTLYSLCSVRAGGGDVLSLALTQAITVLARQDRRLGLDLISPIMDPALAGYIVDSQGYLV